MDPCIVEIKRYRSLLAGQVPSLTRRTLEWLLVNAAREYAALDPYPLPAGDQRQAPELISLADEAVADAVKLMGAQFGGLQLYVAPRDTLVLLACRNFPPEFAARFASLQPDGCTTCSRAVASGRRVVVEDVERDEPFAPHRAAALSAGFRALQSTPLKDRAGTTIGVLTTHYEQPRSFANDELSALDAHADGISARLAHAWG